MGCDIHMHVEYKSKQFTGEDIWYCGDYFSLRKGSTYDNPSFDVMEFHSDRNYALFGLLADVRNYDYEHYIDAPRGLPDDVTDYVKHIHEDWFDDAHSTSYFTLKELIDYYDNNCDDMGDYTVISLTNLIEDLKKRADELGVIYDFCWNGRSYEEAYNKSDKIRIVFWFDN